jgi:hypothetical protein
MVSIEGGDAVDGEGVQAVEAVMFLEATETMPLLWPDTYSLRALAEMVDATDTARRFVRL